MVKSLSDRAGDTRDMDSVPVSRREKEMATHSSIFSGKFHGQRRLVGCSP